MLIELRLIARKPELTRWFILTMLFAACLLLGGIFGTLRSNLVIVVRCPAVHTAALHIPKGC